jgi:hypothetical protein
LLSENICLAEKNTKIRKEEKDEEDVGETKY